MASSNNTFQFGAASGKGFDFKTPGNPDKIFNLPNEERFEGYVTNAQYYLLEDRYIDVIKRLDAIDTQRAAEEAAMAVIKKGTSKLKKAYGDLITSEKQAQSHIKSLETKNAAAETRLAIFKAALQNSQDQYKSCAGDLDAALARLDVAEAEIAVLKGTGQGAGLDLDLEMEQRLHDCKIQLEADLVAEYSANLLEAIDSAAAAPVPVPADEPAATEPASATVVWAVDHEEVGRLREQNAKLEDYEELFGKHLQLVNQAGAVQLGQAMVNWHLIVALVLFCACVAAWLVSGVPAGPGALGFGGCEADTWVARVHGSVFAALVGATGGGKVYL
jgi:hypothetical protein